MYFSDNTVAAVRNGVRHGEPDAGILLTATIGSNDAAVFEVINRAGPTHAAALALQEIHGLNFLMLDAADNFDLAHKGLGAQDSSYQGCCDIRKIAAAMGGAPTLIFQPNSAQFTLRLPGAVFGTACIPLQTVSVAVMTQHNESRAAVTNDQVLSAPPAANPSYATNGNGQSPLVHFLYVDDQNAVRCIRTDSTPAAHCPFHRVRRSKVLW